MDICVDHTKCDLCETCIKECKFNAVSIVDNKIVISDACKFCNKCVKTCPNKAITITKDVNDLKIKCNDEILIVEDTQDTSYLTTLELLSWAHKINKEHSFKIKLLCFRENLLDTYCYYGVDEIFYVKNFNLRDTQAMREILLQCSNKIKPSVVLISASITGRAIAPYLAILKRTGLTADCTSVYFDENNNLIQVRPAFGENIIASITTPYKRPQIATMRPASIEIMPKKNEKCTNLTELLYKETNEFNIIKSAIKETVYNDISKAKRCLILGNAIKDQEDIKKFKAFADKYNLTLCSSRALVDRKLVSHELQVGLSGKSIRADFALILGVSGSTQFLSGIKQVKYSIAVNLDENAPIFKHVNKGVIGDIYSLLE